MEVDRVKRYTYADSGAELRLGSREVLAVLNRHTKTRVDALPVRAAEQSTRTQEGERVVCRTSVVDGDVPQHVLVDLLRQVDVDAQEVRVRLRSLNFLKQALEPAERRSVTADPEELHALERAKGALLLAVPDMLENRSKRRNT